LPKAQSVRDLRRSQIVAAARTVIAGEGLKALTITALEAKLSFTRGVITYHFKNKAEIVDAVFEDVVSEIDAATYSSVSPEADLRQAVDAVMSGMIRGFVKNKEATAVLISYWSRASGVPSEDSSLFARYRRHSARLVRRACPDVDDTTASAIAAIMVALVIGAVIQFDLDTNFASLDAVFEQAVATVYARLSDL
jgi:AcrR family transcriptional regulator